MFQSTHPHGVRRSYNFHQSYRRVVSIHAPTRGATPVNRITAMALVFQSTHPHGVRHGPLQRRVENDRVSIHAPTRGATPSLFSIDPRPISFNPRTHTGCDSPANGLPGSITRFQSTHPHGVRPSLNFNTTSFWKFQSTHPHGVRRHRSIWTPRMRCFNPRTHTGCDT